MTMHLKLSSEMENYIKGKVASGYYGNATEVIRDAIRRMQAEESRVTAWQSAVKLGDEQIERGEGIAYTPERLNVITARAKALMHSDEPMDANVLP
jgi:antitoxin ParD1/3/4